MREDLSPFRKRGNDGREAQHFNALQGRSEGDSWSYSEYTRQMGTAAFPDEGRTDMTRRRFLTLGGATLAASAVGTVDFFKGYTTIGRVLNDSIAGQYDYDELVKETKQILKERFNITLIMGAEKQADPLGQQVLGKSVGLDRYRDSLRVILEEILIYPPEIFRNAFGLREFEIRLIDKLEFTYREGLSSKGEGASATMVNIAGIAPFSASEHSPRIGIDTRNSTDHQRQMIHHELNHKFSEKESKVIGEKWRLLHAQATNSPYRKRNFSSGHGYDAPAEAYFLTLYAGSNAAEDQATCAEYMLIPKLHMKFLDRWRNEKDKVAKEILAAKYNQVKSEYYQWSGGKMGDKFWENIYHKGLKLRERK